MLEDIEADEERYGPLDDPNAPSPSYCSLCETIGADHYGDCDEAGSLAARPVAINSSLARRARKRKS